MRMLATAATSIAALLSCGQARAEGLLLEARPDRMENFKHVDPRWVDVDFDPGRRYTVPWQWGTIGVIVDTSAYSGDPNTSAIFLDPPPELAGKVNVLPEMGDVLSLAVAYEGGAVCTDDKAVLRKVRDRLAAARDKWITLDYPDIEKYTSGDYAVGVTWGGAAVRARLKSDRFVYGYPKEGYPIWMDNVAILKTAPHAENARLFMNFIMDPENAALISAHARYANGINGSGKYMPEDMRAAPEIAVPEQHLARGRFSPACPQAVNDLYTKIWTEVLK